MEWVPHAELVRVLLTITMGRVYHPASLCSGLGHRSLGFAGYGSAPQKAACERGIIFSCGNLGSDANVPSQCIQRP